MLRVGRGMMARLKGAWDRMQPNGQFFEMYQAHDQHKLEAAAHLCRDPTRPLIITAKNTDKLIDVLGDARGRLSKTIRSGKCGASGVRTGPWTI